MKKLLIAFASLLVFFSCTSNEKSKNENPPLLGEVYLPAMFRNADSTSSLDVARCVLKDGVKYDSVRKEKIIVSDTTEVARYIVEVIIDSVTKKPELDSLGYPKRRQGWVPIYKSFVNFDICGKDLLKLSKKGGW